MTTTTLIEELKDRARVTMSEGNAILFTRAAEELERLERERIDLFRVLTQVVHVAGGQVLIPDRLMVEWNDADWTLVRNRTYPDIPGVELTAIGRQALSTTQDDRGER